jgi:single-strand selective monofunctional uracil DNA glycosylase
MFQVSGSRFWGLFRRICGTADQFFRHSFVHNYCPLALMSKTGKNVTPAQLPKTRGGILTESCDQALCDVVKLLGVRFLIGIGKYAQQRAQTALKTYEPDLEVEVLTLMHPSPINPSANKGWEPIAEKQLQEMGVYHMIAADRQPTIN